MQLWQIHNAEQMILDDLEGNPDKYKGKKLSELTDDEDFDEENSVIHTKAYYKKALLPKVILVSTFLQSLYWLVCCCIHLLFMYINLQKTSVKELDLEPAFAERQVSHSLKFCMFRGQNVKWPQLFDIYIFFSCCLIFHRFEIWEGPLRFLFLWIQHHNKLRREAEERGEKYKIDKLRRNIEMDEYDLLHWRRSFEEREALIRDISWYSHWHYYINTWY